MSRFPLVLGSIPNGGTVVMSNEWIEFNDDHSYADKYHPRVSLDPRRHFRLNAKAVDLLGGPTAVRFLFDASRNRIGIRAEPPDTPRSFRLIPSKTGTSSLVRGFSFCHRFGIKPEYNLAFQGVHLDADGTMILDLTTATRKTSRTYSRVSS